MSGEWHAVRFGVYPRC
ncbi:hypothetical protein OsJ_13568 [Oryza sativa Japonica Group]|uniref:Uncharacterized protein n=1 Tax=Oryza sativa subsp. japonica TaxID=39947 RepID=B9FD37_ORYSJ|nr:hypothetical protein OsJ_13568 [Oryza sativa Japonica Group]